jgi:hypothetical protein
MPLKLKTLFFPYLLYCVHNYLVVENNVLHESFLSYMSSMIWILSSCHMDKFSTTSTPLNFTPKFCPFRIYFIGSVCEVQLSKISYGFKGLVLSNLELKQF